MLGGVDGFLKLLFHTETLQLLGVHAIGEGATEIIHIGQVRCHPTTTSVDRPPVVKEVPGWVLQV